MHDALKPHVADARRRALLDEAARHHRITSAYLGEDTGLVPRGSTSHHGVARRIAILLVLALTVAVAAVLTAAVDGGLRLAGLVLKAV